MHYIYFFLKHNVIHTKSRRVYCRHKLFVKHFIAYCSSILNYSKTFMCSCIQCQAFSKCELHKSEFMRRFLLGFDSSFLFFVLLAIYYIHFSSHLCQCTWLWIILNKCDFFPIGTRSAVAFCLTKYFNSFSGYSSLFFFYVLWTGCCTYRNRALRTSANTLVINLAVSDFFMLAKTPLHIYNCLMYGPALGDYGTCVTYIFL